MTFKKFINKYFNSGNVCVYGMKGTGKDLLFGNVIARRKLPYVSNLNYGYDYNEFKFEDFNIANSYSNFVSGDINYYEYPFPRGTDLYLSDVGVYFPSQCCFELNRRYPNFPYTLALSRQLGFQVMVNSQSLVRPWDKLREQSEIFIHTERCFYFKGLVIQRVTVYDNYDSALAKRPMLKLPPLPRLSKDKQMLKYKRAVDIANYKALYGDIQTYTFIYFNKSKHDTNYFKELLKYGKKGKT